MKNYFRELKCQIFLLSVVQHMLYNLNDMPQEKAYIRMLKNVALVIMSRKMSDNTKKLAIQVFGS